ncbi:MAG: hypothetical protein PVI01_02420 [Gemmatimonadales bacterium]|jgi:hypothetical protein
MPHTSPSLVASADFHLEEALKQPHHDLDPQQQEQVEQALAQARAALGGVSRAGCLGMIFRGFLRSLIPRWRFRGRKLAYFLIGLLVAALSVVTCSAGVDLASLTAEYGEPVPATKVAARRFLEHTGAALQSASGGGRFRMTVSEAEATSALSLGLAIPELTRAMQTVPAEDVQGIEDISELRRMLREREAQERQPRTFRQRLAALLDPHLRTGDVQVRFTGSGQIVVAGYVQAWRWQQPALVVFAPHARSGELELDFVKGRLGRLPAPAWAFDQLGRLVASLILLGGDYAEISELTVDEGRLTFEASVGG